MNAHLTTTAVFLCLIATHAHPAWSEQAEEGTSLEERVRPRRPPEKRGHGASESANRRAISLPGRSYRATDLETLRNRFVEPPRAAGPWVYWMMFDNVVNKKEISRQLKEMADAGIAGAEMRWLVARGFPSLIEPRYGPDIWARLEHRRLEFLSPEFVDVLEHTCAEAQCLGVKLAMNLGMGWPPGGTWITNEHRSKHLQAASHLVTGPRPLSSGEVTVPAQGMVFAWQIDASSEDGCVAPASFRDLTENVDARQGLRWEIPNGSWLIGIFHHTYGGICDKGNGPEADPGSREAVLFHLNHVFSRLEPKLGKYFGTTLVEVASDSWEYTRPRTGRYWSPALFDTYSAQTGKPLAPRMYALLGRGPDRETILRELDAAGRRAIQKNFYETLADYLHERGLRHRPQVRGRGLPRDFFDAYASADVPEIEEEVCLPEAVWTSHVLGKPIVSAEAFTFLSGHAHNLTTDARPRHGPLDDPHRRWETTPGLMRQHANAHFARGINRIQIHGYSYSPPGVPPPGWRMYAEIHLNRNVPWWSAMPEFSRWVARNQLMLQSGGPFSDVVVYPVRANPPDGPFNAATDQPTSALNAVDAASQSTFAALRKRSGHVPYDFHRFVLLEDVRTSAEAQRIAGLIADNVVLVCCKVMPDDWSVFVDQPGSAVLSALQEEFRTAFGQGKVIDARADGWRTALAQSQSVKWQPEDAPLSYQHRRIDGGEIYFLMNWGTDFDGEVSYPHASLVPELWDAQTGTSNRAGQYRIENGRTWVRVSLPRLESTFLVFTNREPLLHAVACDGGVAEADSHGRLYAVPSGAESCRVQLSDGRQLTVNVSAHSSQRLSGPWTLTAAPKDGVGLEVAAKVELEDLPSWREIPAFQRFAGTATYTTQLTVPDEYLERDVQLWLELGRVHEVATVWINGQRVGTTWHAPFRLEISNFVRIGTNELRIDVANVLKNHLEQGQNYTRPSGLLGPVALRPMVRARLSGSN